MKVIVDVLLKWLYCFLMCVLIQLVPLKKYNYDIIQKLIYIKRDLNQDKNLRIFVRRNESFSD